MENRTPAHWDSQPCPCGSLTWCGRDRHRPDYAVDESNSTIFFNEDGEPDIEAHNDSIVVVSLLDLLNS